MQYLPSTQVYTLLDLNVDTSTQVVDFNSVLLASLEQRTLSEIRNAFRAAVRITPPGQIFFAVSQLRGLLRTGNSRAENYMWQHGIDGYVSPSRPYTLDGELCIAGADFLALVQARIQSTFGRQNTYLKYVRALYFAIASLEILIDLRNGFISDIEAQRTRLKKQRIAHYGIRHCEFTGAPYHSQSDVQFAHIDSVVTSPLEATNINNGVIIFKNIHSELTSLGIHDFAGMYDFCLHKGYSTDWADTYYR